MSSRSAIAATPRTRPEQRWPTARTCDRARRGRHRQRVVNGLLEALARVIRTCRRSGWFRRAGQRLRPLGLSRTRWRFTHQLLQAVTHRRFRWVGLGRADDRWFTFNAGVGLDAEAVARVEQARRAGAPPRPPVRTSGAAGLLPVRPPGPADGAGSTASRRSTACTAFSWPTPIRGLPGAPPAVEPADRFRQRGSARPAQPHTSCSVATRSRPVRGSAKLRGAKSIRRRTRARTRNLSAAVALAG